MKGKTDEEILAERINRNIVECKAEEQYRIFVVPLRINRNIVECKGRN